MKKIGSLNFNKRKFLIGTTLSIVFVGTLVLNKFVEASYNSRKSELEERLEKFLNKKVELGDYSGIRLFGISLANSKIVDSKNISSEIKAKNTYVGIMPIKSLLKQKWIIDIRPKKAKININKDFFKREEFNIKENKIFKNIKNNSHMYFVHSYEFIPVDKNVISATTDYSTKVICSVEKENLFGTQFHPEKSDKIGLKIIDNFINL